jgi:hypothetical protein
MRIGPLALMACLAGACSSSSSFSPNVDSSKALTSLSASDQGRLCDWEAQQYGGYGKVMSCGGLVAGQRAPADQASCVSALPPSSASMYCPVTVGQFENCVHWKVQNGCGTADPPTDCAALRNPNCASYDAGAD